MKISIDNLRYTYRRPQIEDRTVLDVEQWTVDSGAHVLLRGISGSGKTTLLNVLAGLLPPTQGKVQVGEQAIYDLPEVQRDRFRAETIGYVFQMHLLVATLSALENVEMPLVFGGANSSAQRRSLVLETLDQVGLADFARHRPAQMSTGQRLRVAVARALVSRPQVLLADEPTAALDTASAVTIMDLLQERCRADNATLIIASHDPSLTSRFDRVCDLRSGRLLEELKPCHQEDTDFVSAGAMRMSER